MSHAPEVSDRLRKVAILVASLDGALAAKLLADLPAGDLMRVEEQLGRLSEIDPEERASVLAEFRGAVGQQVAAPTASAEESVSSHAAPAASRSTDGVEANFSAESEAAADAPPTIPSPPAQPANPLEAAAPATVAQLLADEHPQTVAIILSRLSEEQAGDVFALLAPELQTGSLDRLAMLDDADAEALADVERQLAARLETRQREEQRLAAGANLAMKMLSKTDPQRRATLLTRLSLPGLEIRQDSVEDDAGFNSDEPPLAAAASPALDSDAAKPGPVRKRLLAALGRRPILHAAGNGDAKSQAEPPIGDEFAAASESLPNASELCDRLAALDPPTLAAALSAAGQRTAQLALVASGRPLVKRIAARLPRRQAVALKKQLAAVGPASLAELCSAQARVLEIADHLTDATATAAAA